MREEIPDSAVSKIHYVSLPQLCRAKYRDIVCSSLCVLLPLFTNEGEGGGD